jgi:hypothetical protein
VYARHALGIGARKDCARSNGFECVTVFILPSKSIAHLHQSAKLPRVDFLRKSISNPSQICLSDPREPWALTDMFAMDSVLISLRNQPQRALGSDRQICDGFDIDFLKKSTLGSFAL